MAEQDENKVEIEIRQTNGKHIHLVGQPGANFALSDKGVPILRKNNLTAIIAPTVNDDIDAGYVTGADWFDTVLRKWHKLGKNDAGAAEWDILN